MKPKLFKGIQLLCFALLTSLMFQSCSDDDFRFNLELRNLSFKVSPIGGPFNEMKIFVNDEITTGIANLLAENGASTDDIESALLQEFTIKIVAPQGANFDNVEFLEVFINGTGLSETKLAFSEGDLNGKTTLTLTTQGAELASFVKLNSFQVKVQGFINEAISEEVDVSLDLVILVKGSE